MRIIEKKRKTHLQYNKWQNIIIYLWELNSLCLISFLIKFKLTTNLNQTFRIRHSFIISIIKLFSAHFRMDTETIFCEVEDIMCDQVILSEVDVDFKTESTLTISTT